MTTEVINIVVREDGSRVVKRNIDEIGGAADNASNLLGKFKVAIAAIAGGVIANQIRQLTSQWTDLNSRINLATGSQGQANAVMERLQEIARRTYTDLNITSEAYLRNAASLTELGFSTKQQIDFTEALANALVVSGAKAERAESVTNALSKAIASGTLRGENLNTVLESGGRVAVALAEGLGVGVNELRALGAQGKLTSDVVLPALNSQLEQLREEADSMPATINDALTNLRSQLMVTVGSFFDATGASTGLVSVIDSIRTTLEEVTPQILNFGRALTGSLDPMDELSDAGKVFATIFVTVFGVLKAVGQLLTGTVLLAFKTAGKVIGGVVAAIMAVLSGDFKGAFEIVKEAGTDIATTWADDSNRMAQSAIDTTSEMFMKLDQIWNKGTRDIQDRSASIVEPIDDTRSKIKTPGPDPKELAKQQRELEKIRNALSSLLGTVDPLGQATLEYAKNQETLAKAYEKGLISIEQLTRYSEILAAQYAAQLDPLSRLNQELDEQLRLLGMSAREREIEAQVLAATRELQSQGVILTQQETEALRDKFKALQDLNTAVALQDQLLQESVEKRQGFIDQLKAITTLLNDPNSGFGATDATAALAQQNPELFEGTQEMLDLQLAQFQYYYEQIDLMRQANLISEQTAAQMYAKIEQQQFELRLKTTQAFFGTLAGLAQSGNSKIAKIGQAAALVQATIDGASAVMKAYASAAYPANIALAAAQAALSAVQISKIASANTGFATGGEFRVGGSGGTDSQMVSFRATPGEKVAVSTPQQVRKGDPNSFGGGGSGEPMVVEGPTIINVRDPKEIPNAIQSSDGKDAIINVVSENAALFRQILQQN